MVGKQETVEDDLRWRDAILAGDVASWHQFVRRHSNLAVETAVRWCSAGCRFPSGCTLRRGGGEPFERFLRGDCACDRAGNAYAFILEKLREKLVVYRGERGCRLDTWVRHLLVPAPRGGSSRGQDYGYRQLYADFVRSQEGRIRPPVEILRTDPVLEQVYLQVRYGKADDEICELLALTPAGLANAVAAIEDRLRARGAEFFWRFWGHLWIPRDTASLDGADPEEDDSTIEPPAAGVDPDIRWRAAAIQQAIAEAMASLPPLTRHLLWLALDESMSAPEIAAELRAHDLARWAPRRVYSEIDRALADLGRRISALLAPLDDVDLGPRRIRGILDYWSVRRFLPRGTGERTQRR